MANKRYVVGANPYVKTPLPASADGCDLNHPFWKKETCGSVQSSGWFRMGIAALFSRSKTVKAHSYSSPKLPRFVKWILVTWSPAIQDYHLKASLASNPNLTGKDVLTLSEDRKMVSALRGQPRLFSLPGVADYYIDNDFGRKDWFSSIEALEPAFYDRLAEDRKCWNVLSVNPSTPASALRVIANSDDSVDVAKAVVHPNYPLEDLLCGPQHDSYVDEEILKAMESRAEEVSAWLEVHHPELTSVPHEWVRSVLSAVMVSA